MRALGIKERRQRQRQQLRDGILAAAREIASKEDLLLELVRMGYAGQLAAVESAREASDDPEEALLAMARAWCRFAFDSPDLYQVMYGLGGVSFPVPELRKEGEKIAEVMERTIGEVLEKNGKDATDVRDKVVFGWGTLHGIVALAMGGRIAGGEEEVERLVDLAIRDFLTAWEEN